MENRNFIKEFWDTNAQKYEQSHWVSWGDNWAIDLELKNISEYIKPKDHVLDIGCANGFGTLFQASEKPISIVGVDFSGKMIEQAKKQIISKNNLSIISFQVADILDLPYENDLFDVAYTTRVIINLPNWELQKKAITECMRVTKKGGTVILSEAFWEPLVLLNSMRCLVSLPPLVEHDFNRYLKKEKLERFLID